LIFISLLLSKLDINRLAKMNKLTMKQLYFLLLITIAIAQSSHAQQKNKAKTPLIDLFYQAISTKEEIEFNGSEFNEISLSDYEFVEISPRTIIAKYPDAKRFLVNDSIMVVNFDTNISGFIEDFSTSDAKIEIRNFLFKGDTSINLNLYGELKEEVFNASDLSFKNCIFEDRLWIWFSNFVLEFEDNEINRLRLINESMIAPKITINNNKINSLDFWTAAAKDVLIGNNQIGYLEVDLSSALTMSIINNTFERIKDSNATDQKFLNSTIRLRKAQSLVSEGKLKWDRDSIMNFIVNKGERLLHFNSTDRVIADLRIVGNTFLDPTRSKLVIFDQQSIKMKISNNVFEAPVILSPAVSSDFILEYNNFYKVNMSAALPSTPQNHVSIDWKDLKGKLYYQEDEDSLPYFGQTDTELKDTRNFYNLIAGHSRLLEVYKSYGNLDDANDVFLDMKALHLERYEYLYRTEGGTTNFFQLYLNKLLSVYTRHGTDPAQAMTASLWIIIFFSFIYFFFPSDWDASSKSKLITNFKTFIEKNEKGYFKPFLMVIKGLVTSFFNAITLSVNSFVTLGFGTIPTRGLAKYICIFQGFLGWFLLSIFIVALINQILI